MGNADGSHAKRALKEVSVQQLETAIAAALFKITAHRYHVDIKRFDLDLGHDVTLRDGAVIEMRVADCGALSASGAISNAAARFCLDPAPDHAGDKQKKTGPMDRSCALNEVDAKG